MGSVFVPTAWQVILSALVAGASAALAVIGLDIAKIINVDFLGGMAVVVATAGVKYLQKLIAQYQAKGKAGS